MKYWEVIVNAETQVQFSVNSKKKKNGYVIKLDIYSFVKHKIQPTSFLLSVDLLQFFVDEIMT